MGVAGIDDQAPGGIDDLVDPVGQVVVVGRGVGLGADGPGVFGDVAAVVVGVLDVATAVVDLGEPPEALVAASGVVVGIGDVVGRGRGVLGLGQAGEVVVAVVGDDVAGVRTLGQVAGGVVLVVGDAGIGALRKCWNVKSDPRVVTPVSRMRAFRKRMIGVEMI